MGVPSSGTASSTTVTRLKREDFRRTKHDSAFSQWKILIGPFDWGDHSSGKEGAEKYRTQNLPNWTSCPGVYELGVVASRPQSGSGPRKLESNSVVPVYLGQADNLRTRLQHYGRNGAHLENGCLNNKLTDCQSGSSHKGLGLFTDIFSRGSPIVYRCAPRLDSLRYSLPVACIIPPDDLLVACLQALDSVRNSLLVACVIPPYDLLACLQMTSKKDAEITERQLLDKFNYAWNKGSNGERRPDDIHRKLDHLAKQSQFSLLAKKFLFVRKKQVGVKIKTPESCLSKNGSNSSDMDDVSIFSRIFRVKRLQPKQVQFDYSGDICGVAIGHGSVCTTRPVEGRKRCALHKGMRVNGYVSKLGTEGKSVLPLVPSGGSVIVPNQNVVEFQDHVFALACGFIMENGSPCRRKPVPRNKRCLEHKGRRIRRFQSESVREELE
ncbi:hypothetical protein OROGR_006231 [Orobanche gracilis]